MKTEAIICEWAGRSGDCVKVYGVSDITEARKEALKFAECPDGITLDDGFFCKWPYEEPQEEDWKDHFFFRAIDECQSDMREWWEK